MAWVYILRCSDGSYYTGSAVDLEKRIAEHMTGAFNGFTSKRLPVKLVYSCEMPTLHDAFLRERQIKGWARRKKEALINGDWDKLIEYSKSKGGDPSTSSGC
jgi:predicted GIY-YIG superfamily endonuclease